MTKEHFKQYLRHNGLAYMTAEALYENALYVPSVGRHAVSSAAESLRAAILGGPQAPPVLTWDVPFPQARRAADLIAWLRLQGVEVSEGGHTFYVAPQPALCRILPAATAFYPAGAGFKVLKDLRHPAHARYIYKHPRSLRMLQTLIGAPRDQLVAANYMHMLGIGPRVWDVCCWSGRETQCTVFVVDHVAGRAPTLEEWRAFVRHLEGINTRSHLRVLAPRWRDTMDFQPPDCNRNLVYSGALGRVQYVDFQNFGLVDRGAWRREMAIDRAWRAVASSLSRALRNAGVEVRDRLVVDAACGGGGRLHVALVGGAAWAVGLDRANALPLAAARLFAYGAARFDLVAAEPNEPRSLPDLVPRRLWPMLSRAVVFCPASRVRLLANLSAAPWSVIACEGETSGSALDVLSRLQCLAQVRAGDSEILAVTDVRVESGARHPLVVVRRRRSGTAVEPDVEQAG